MAAPVPFPRQHHQRVSDRALSFCAIFTLVFQVSCFCVHVWSKQSVVAVEDHPLSSAEEHLLSLLGEDRVFAREILVSRARGPQKQKKTEEDFQSLRPPGPRPKIARPHRAYGSRRLVYGKEHCSMFRSSTSTFRRAAVAGLFNTGTNLLTRLLRANCVPPSACPPGVGPKKQKELMAKKECIGYPYQVP